MTNSQNPSQILANQHAIITGGGRGIGFAIAQALASLGATISIMGRTKSTLEQGAIKLEKEFDQKVNFTSIDVADTDKIAAAFKEIQSKAGPANILINNAGSVESAPFLKTDLHLWRAMFDVNVTGAYLCIKEVLPAMLKAKHGKIVNIVSTAALRGYPYISAYCAAKHALLGLTRALAIETKGSGVTVNAVCPGFTDTDLVRNAIQKVAAKTGRSQNDIEAEYLRSVPSGRFIEPKEVANIVAWLCRTEQEAITGQELVIAGGEIL